MIIITGAELLAWAGATNPNATETAWATACADAVNAALAQRVPDLVDTDPGWPDVKAAATIAGGELYKRREAPFGVVTMADAGELVRLARDYLAPVMPIVNRWTPTGGVTIG